MRSFVTICFILLIPIFQANASTKATKEVSVNEEIPKSQNMAFWFPLYTKLINDGFKKEDILPIFQELGDNFSQKPMGNKVKELYNAKFAPKKPKTKQEKQEQKKANKLGVPYPWYPGYVTTENAIKCQSFIQENKDFFAKAEKKFSVPKEILSALIYVETWHGNFLGKHNPLVMLTSMASSTSLSQLPDYTKDLSLNSTQKKWLEQKITARADWAYDELKALIKYGLENDIALHNVPSSIYGAIGYGQFMPTNIPRFAIDGDNDNKIDLFHAPDAIFSVANFLHKQGWKSKNLQYKQQVKVLKRYNYSTAYANTIIALAKLTKQTTISEK